MSVLHVELVPRAGAEGELVDLYRDRFRPAITAQPGFRAVRLLRSEEPGSWRLSIEFDTEEQRLAWVDTDVHIRVWGAIEERLESYQPIVFDEVSPSGDHAAEGASGVRPGGTA